MKTSIRQMLLLSVLVGCGEEDPVAPKIRPIGYGIAILPESLSTTILHLGDTTQLRAARRDKSGAIRPNDAGVFIWESSDTSVIRVFPDGIVHAIALGSATIRARLADSLAPFLPSLSDTSTGKITLTVSYTVLDAGPVIAADLDRTHQCYVRAGGQMFCRGDNSRGQLGLGYASTTPVDEWSPVVGGLLFASVSTSTFHTCGLTTDQRAFCWGSNASAQHGIGTVPSTINQPRELPGDFRWLSVEADGHAQTCGVTTTNVPYCVGHNDWGQLGRGPAVQRDSAFAQYGSGHLMTAIWTADFYTCGLNTAGAVYCSGESGPPTNSVVGQNTLIPVRMSGDAVLTSLSLGDFHACGLDAANIAWCWGYGWDGRLGTGDLSNSGTARPVAGGLTFSKLFALTYTTCGAAGSGETYCWGVNLGNVFGSLVWQQSLTPRKLPLGTSVSWIGHRYGGGTCAIDEDARLICWGGGY